MAKSSVEENGNDKDLLIGAADIYDWDKVRIWARSIKDTGFTGDVILLVYRTTDTVIQECHKLGIGVLKVDHDPQGQPINHNAGGRDTQAHQMRFFHIWQYLQTCDIEYRHVIITDVRDVVFQVNPQDWFWPDFEGIVAPSESILFKNEAWNLNNVTNAFGPYVAESLKEYNVYNVGTIAGTGNAMKGLCLTLYLMGVGHYIPNDQAAFNVLLGQAMLSAQRTGNSSAWAAQCGTTMDTEKSHLWPFLTDNAPRWIGNAVVNHRDEPYIMVHQYDRVPELNEFFEKKYGYQEYSIQDKVSFRIDPTNEGNIRYAFDYFNREDNPEVGERHEMANFLELTKDKKSFLDIGSLFGIFCFAFTQGKPDKSALAIEPSNLPYQILTNNLNLNENDDIGAYQLLLGETEEMVYVKPDWLHVVVSSTPTGEQMRAMTLDTLVRETGFIPDTIKIDVEGFEQKILNGATETLSRRPLLFIEIHHEMLKNFGDSIESVNEKILSFGYEPYTFHNEPISNLLEFLKDRATRWPVSRIVCK